MGKKKRRLTRGKFTKKFASLRDAVAAARAVVEGAEADGVVTTEEQFQIEEAQKVVAEATAEVVAETTEEAPTEETPEVDVAEEAPVPEKKAAPKKKAKRSRKMKSDDA